MLVLFAAAGLLLGYAPAAHAGTWRISVFYTGLAAGYATAVHFTPPGASSIVKASEAATGMNVPVPLNTLTGASSDNGRVLGELVAIVDGGTDSVDVFGTSEDAAMVFQVTWVPNASQLYPDPPPAYVDVCYRRRVEVAAQGHVQGGEPGTENAWSRSSATATLGDLVATTGTL